MTSRPSRQLSQRLTAKSLSTPGIGTPSSAKWNLEQMCTSTRWARLVSHHWSRISAALGRLTQYLPSDWAQTWHVVVADDYHLEAGGQSYRFALLCFFVLCSVVGVPLSWHKTSGGDSSGLGWLRTVAPDPPPGHLATKSRVVHEVGTRSRRSNSWYFGYLFFLRAFHFFTFSSLRASSWQSPHHPGEEFFSRRLNLARSF